jgi:hypothetical protein
MKTVVGGQWLVNSSCSCLSLATYHLPLLLNRLAFENPSGYPPDGMSTCRRRTIQFSKISECRTAARAPFGPAEPCDLSLRRFVGFEVVSPCCEPTSNSTVNPALPSPHNASPSRASCVPGGFRSICFELKGLKQAGWSCAVDPLASNPYPKALRVLTSNR